jgi:hypothetical protein
MSAARLAANTATISGRASRTAHAAAAIEIGERRRIATRWCGQPRLVRAGRIIRSLNDGGHQAASRRRSPASCRRGKNRRRPRDGSPTRRARRCRRRVVICRSGDVRFDAAFLDRPSDHGSPPADPLPTCAAHKARSKGGRAAYQPLRVRIRRSKKPLDKIYVDIHILAACHRSPRPPTKPPK